MKSKLQTVILIIASVLLCAGASMAQATVEVKSLAARLGYPEGAKLLIVHADDVGAAHSVNAATVKAFETGLVNSGSVMVPCPWLPEAAAYARAHPEADLGLHLTLTSEWKTYRWRGVVPADRTPTLYDAEGYLYPTESEAAAHISVSEAEAEVRAQIERARAFGIRPTHLDAHMRTLYTTRPLFEMLLRVARENGLPVMVSREWFADMPFLPQALGPDGIVVERVLGADPSVAPARWPEFYADLIKNLRPGVSELIVHLGYDDEELRAVTQDHPNWGAAWRQRDFDFVTSPAFRRLLKENNVTLVTWREIGKLVAQP
ncbi:MAG TPA: polysaccharide deacetylase family protein [Pyrinomonadaceae bacterium]|nr:polysaccharide deacetylase family protein [Pyrinomonadaceae bacterium]